MFDDVIAAKVTADPTWYDTRPARAYTWGSPDGIAALIAALPDRHPMDLVREDMGALVKALAWTAETAECDSGDADHARNRGDCPDTCWQYRAGSLLGTIAETLNVDWI